MTGDKGLDLQANYDILIRRLATLQLCVGLGQSCVELHFGTVLKALSQ